MAKEAPTDGLTKPITMSITISPQPGGKMDVSVAIPEDLAQAWVIWKMLGDSIMGEAIKNGTGVVEPQRQVKTLDEMGMRLGTRLHRG